MSEQQLADALVSDLFRSLQWTQASDARGSGSAPKVTKRQTYTSINGFTSILRQRMRFFGSLIEMRLKLVAK